MNALHSYTPELQALWGVHQRAAFNQIAKIRAAHPELVERIGSAYVITRDTAELYPPARPGNHSGKSRRKKATNGQD